MSDALQYHELAPPSHLRPHIRCIWRLRGAPPIGAASAAEPIVPDGCVELVLNMGDPFVRRMPDGTSHVQPLRLVAGQISRSISIAAPRHIDLWGVRFHPWSAASFLGVSANELRDEFLTIDDAAPSLDASFRRLGDRDSDDGRFATIVSVLEARSARVRATDDVLPDLVRLASHGNESLSVRGLARRASLSTRRVQTLFRDRVGLAPKRLMRITRFQRALGLARANDSLSWSAIAARAGYYDQAHLIHEAQDIVGCTPAELLDRDADLTDAFLAE